MTNHLPDGRCAKCRSDPTGFTALLEKVEREFDTRFQKIYAEDIPQGFHLEPVMQWDKNVIKFFLRSSLTQAYNEGLEAAKEGLPPLNELDGDFSEGFNRAITHSKSAIESLLVKE